MAVFAGLRGMVCETPLYAKITQTYPTMPRILYTLAFYCLLPLMLLRLLWRARRQPAYLSHLGERFGFYRSQPPAQQPLIWIHAVSVGETRATAPLVALLNQRYPAHRILLTHTTPTGRDAGTQLYGDEVLRCYLPYDLPGAMARFLAHFCPQIGLVMETELWFNLIAACERETVPLLLVNARLSARSARGYKRIGKLMRQGLKALSGIAAQTETDAARLRKLGAHDVQVVGNLKFDVSPPTVQDSGAVLRPLFNGGRPVFLAASTRDGEEALVLDAVAQANIPGMLTVIVPRHPQRFAEVAALLEKRGVKFRYRSDNLSAESDCPVVLGDSMGEMFAYYAACDVTFVGGSLLPYGGQNLIEPCSMGKPVLIGPHTFNFEQSAELAVTDGAALRVENVAALAKALTRLFGDVELRTHMGEAALAFSASHRGAAEKTVELVGKFIAQA